LMLITQSGTVAAAVSTFERSICFVARRKRAAGCGCR
jgi:hypothetical protein